MDHRLPTIDLCKACIFDAFGTLFNLDKRLLQHIDHPAVQDILEYTRSRQLSYTRNRLLFVRNLSRGKLYF